MFLLKRQVKFFICLFLVGCATYESSSGAKDLIENAISPGPATYTMTYREQHSREIKRVIGHYQAQKLHECFYLIEEKFEFAELSSKTAKYYINTYQLNLSNIDPQKIELKVQRQNANSKIKFLSGNDYVYILQLPYDYRRNALIPYTSTSLVEGDVDASKSKLVNLASIQFSDIGNANQARRAFVRSINSCLRQ